MMFNREKIWSRITLFVFLLAAGGSAAELLVNASLPGMYGDNREFAPEFAVDTNLACMANRVIDSAANDKYQGIVIACLELDSIENDPGDSSAWKIHHFSINDFDSLSFGDNGEFTRPNVLVWEHYVVIFTNWHAGDSFASVALVSYNRGESFFVFDRFMTDGMEMPARMFMNQTKSVVFLLNDDGVRVYNLWLRLERIVYPRVEGLSRDIAFGDNRIWYFKNDSFTTSGYNNVIDSELHDISKDPQDSASVDGFAQFLESDGSMWYVYLGKHDLVAKELQYFGRIERTIRIPRVQSDYTYILPSETGLYSVEVDLTAEKPWKFYNYNFDKRTMDLLFEFDYDFNPDYFEAGSYVVASDTTLWSLSGLYDGHYDLHIAGFAQKDEVTNVGEVVTAEMAGFWSRNAEGFLFTNHSGGPVGIRVVNVNGQIVEEEVTVPARGDHQIQMSSGVQIGIVQAGGRFESRVLVW